MARKAGIFSMIGSKIKGWVEKKKICILYIFWRARAFFLRSNGSRPKLPVAPPLVINCVAKGSVNSENFAP